MFLRNISDCQISKSISDDKMTVASHSEQNMVAFPYTGPPGTGPGLLGSKPGAGKSDYLLALEHYATSLKSALAIAASLKGGKNKDLDIEIVYNSICDIEDELQNQNSWMSPRE